MRTLNYRRGIGYNLIMANARNAIGTASDPREATMEWMFACAFVMYRVYGELIADEERTQELHAFAARKEGFALAEMTWLYQELRRIDNTDGTLNSEDIVNVYAVLNRYAQMPTDHYASS